MLRYFALCSAILFMASQAFPDCHPHPECWIRSAIKDCDTWTNACNIDICQPVCSKTKEETAEILSIAMKLQAELQKDFSLNDNAIIGSHNSFISNAHGVGIEEMGFEEIFGNSKSFKETTRTVIANQRLSITEQLKLGIRHLEIDLHRNWIVSGDEIKICHWTISPLNLIYYVERAQYQNSKLLLQNELSRGSSGTWKRWDKYLLGCNRRSLNFNDGLSEISNFSKGNPDEFLILYLDSRMNIKHFPVFYENVEAQLGWKNILTPIKLRDIFNATPVSFPSVTQLKSHGFRFMFEVLVPEWEVVHDVIFPRTWEEFSFNEFNAENCTLNGKSSLGLFSRALDDSLSFGPSKAFNVSSPPITENGLRNLLKCGVQRLALDQITPQYLKHAIWTFAEEDWFKLDEVIPFIPSLDSSIQTVSFHSGASCIIMNASGNWTFNDAKCSSSSVACRGKSELEQFRPGNVTISLSSQCPYGYFVDLPRTSAENEKILIQMKENQVETVYLTSLNK